MTTLLRAVVVCCAAAFASVPSLYAASSHRSAIDVLVRPPRDWGDDSVRFATQDVERGLLEWSIQYEHSNNTGIDSKHFPVFLIVGVKTSVVHNFRERQAIRATWANVTATRPRHVRVVFLGCEPDLSTYSDPIERARISEAVAIEKDVYQDLLTSELACTDSYSQLTQKVASFLHWTSATIAPSQSSLRYVLIVDDDVYLRVDKLVEMLHRNDTPKTRFYGGYVFRDLQPTRDPAHKNFISEHEYAGPTLPPFAAGPHYIISIDIAHHLTQHHAERSGLRALDDISVALWLQAMDIHPTDVDGFLLLRTTPCVNAAVALGDLTPTAVRRVHSNIYFHRDLCDGLQDTSSMRHHRSIVLPESDASAEHTSGDTVLHWHLYHDAKSYVLHVGVKIAIAKREVAYRFSPATTSYELGLCALGARLLLSQLYVVVDEPFCQYHRHKLRQFMDAAIQDTPGLEPMLTLPRHSLSVDTNQIKTVGLSSGATFARTLVECLLVKMYPTARILVIREDKLDELPDIFVFSSLDDGAADGVPDGQRFIDDYGDHSQLIMVAGEPWPPEQLDERVILVTTVQQPLHCRQIYLPVASTVFAETMNHTPLELLLPYADKAETSSSTRRFCAYLYARCDRLRREYMFDLLNDLEPVDALGACQGAKRNSNPISGKERYEEAFYTDMAIQKYVNYKFVVAFENTVAPGYITEKIVTAFLAGAVPIYFGHSTTATRLFNPDAFINCADFLSLRACALHVFVIHTSPEKYEAMRRAAPVLDRARFYEIFGWHPAVTASMSTGDEVPIAHELKRLLEHE